MPLETMVRGGVLPDVDHLGAGVGLLPVVGQRHGIELAHGVVAHQQAARILPGDGRAGLHLGPRDLGIHAAACAPLGDEVVDAALAFLVAGIPVLHGGVLDLGVIEGHQLDHRGVQLVGVAHGGGATLQVADVGAFVGHDQGALELPGVLGVDAEVGGKLHGAAHAFGHVAEGAVAEDRGIQGREEVVGGGNHRAEVLAHQVGVLAHGFGERAEDDPHGLQLLLEGGGHGDRVEHGIDRDASQQFLFFQRDAELGVGLQKLRIDLVEALGAALFRFGRGIVNDVLVIDGRVVNVGPGGLLHGLPVAEGLEPPFQQPFRFLFLGGDQADDVFVEAAGDGVGFDIGDEPPLIFLIRKGLDGVGRIAHPLSS